MKVRRKKKVNHRSYNENINTNKQYLKGILTHQALKDSGLVFDGHGSSSQNVDHRGDLNMRAVLPPGSTRQMRTNESSPFRFVGRIEDNEPLSVR